MLFDKDDVLQRVLITRPEPGATETAARLMARGLFPVVAPIFSVKPGKLRPPKHVAATVLTSRNAIIACPATLYDHPVFAVGTATATAATQAGFRRVFNADGDAVALSNVIADTLSPKSGTLFLPTGQGQGQDLTTSLRQRGFRVLRRVAYRTIGVETLPDAVVSLLRQGQLTTAMFFSGETSRHFVHLVRAAALIDTVGEVDAVSISERAAVALRLLRWRRIKVAARPNQDAMLALLEHD
jgi:uroporphyrinogen-III synthase